MHLCLTLTSKQPTYLTAKVTSFWPRWLWHLVWRCNRGSSFTCTSNWLHWRVQQDQDGISKDDNTNILRFGSWGYCTPLSTFFLHLSSITISRTSHTGSRDGAAELGASCMQHNLVLNIGNRYSSPQLQHGVWSSYTSNKSDNKSKDLLAFFHTGRLIETVTQWHWIPPKPLYPSSYLVPLVI